MKLLLVRHCKAGGQEPEAALTEIGRNQAKKIVPLLNSFKIERVISSPYQRAVATIEPFASSTGLIIERDARLVERCLSSQNLPNWEECLQRAFSDFDLTFPGGESSKMALARVEPLLEEVEYGPTPTVLVTHGNLLALILSRYGMKVGFEQWQKLSNPDVFEVKRTSEGYEVERIWID